MFLTLVPGATTLFLYILTLGGHCQLQIAQALAVITPVRQLPSGMGNTRLFCLLEAK